MEKCAIDYRDSLEILVCPSVSSDILSLPAVFIYCFAYYKLALHSGIACRSFVNDLNFKASAECI